MNWIDIVGHFGSFLLSVTFIPQVYKVWKKVWYDPEYLYDIDCYSKHIGVYWYGNDVMARDHLQRLLSVSLYFKFTFKK